MIKLISDDEFLYKLLIESVQRGELKGVKRIIALPFSIDQFLESLKSSIQLEDKILHEIKDKLIDYEKNKLKEIDDPIVIKLDLLLSISDRYLMIKDLLRNEKNIAFGLWGLLFYLGLTCFDALGQKGKYKTFYEWLVWKKNQDFKTLKRKIKLAEVTDLEKHIVQLYNKYLIDYGSKNSFFNFLNLLNSKKSFYALLSCIDISSFLKKQLEFQCIYDKFILGWLYEFRNDFTHNAKNRRWKINDEDPSILCLSYCYKEKYYTVNIKKTKMIYSILDCIKDGLELKLHEILPKLLYNL